MRQFRVILAVMVIMAVGLTAIAFAAEKPVQTKAAPTVTPTPPKVDAPKALSAEEEQQLQKLTQQFLAERDKFHALQRSGAQASQIDAQRKQMEQAHEAMRALCQQTCPNQAGVGRGNGADRGPGAGARGAGRGRGSGRHGMGRTDGTAPDQNSMGRGRGGRHRMGRTDGTVPDQNSMGRDPGHGRGHGRHGMMQDGVNGGRGGSMCRMNQEGADSGRGSGMERGGGMHRGAGMGRGGGQGQGGHGMGRGMGRGQGGRGGMSQPDQTIPVPEQSAPVK